jgi:hypothetical protein
MAENDPGLQSGIEAWNQICAERSQAQADFDRAVYEGDASGMIEARRRITTYNGELRSLRADYNDYVAANQPPPEPSKEERAARSFDRMDRQDMWNLANSGKYGADPNAFAAGEAEVRRRRMRGE